MDENNNKPIESKSYELKIDEDIIKLIMELNSNETILFKAKKKEDLSFHFFIREYNYEELIKILLLQKEIYTNTYKIFQFYDISLCKKKISLKYNNNNTILKLILRKIVDYDEVDCILDLVWTKQMIERVIKYSNKDNIIDYNIRENEIIKNNIHIMNDLIQSLIKDNEEIKNDNKKLIKENEEMKNDIKSIVNCNNDMKKNIELLLKEKEEIKNDIKILLKENKNIKNQLEDEKKPKQYFNFVEHLTENCSCNEFQSIEVYTGLFDHIEYLAYFELCNSIYNINIMRIKDNKIVKQLTNCGYNSNYRIIKYFKKSDREDYLLSSYKYTYFFSNFCQIIIFDIQNNFNKKYVLDENINEGILDALLLFNIIGKDYIVISNLDYNNSTKLYEFNNYTPFVKNISGTNTNKTHYLIPWEYLNNYYIIELCEKKISINNLLKDNDYTNLSFKGIIEPYSGYIFNKNYLCVCDRKNGLFRIWDLIKKIQYKKITYIGTGFSIIPWNDNIAVISTKSNLYIIDLNNNESYLASSNYNIIYDIKKIRLEQLGECLICNHGNTISLLCL